MGYQHTLIAVADDCPARIGEVPPPRGDRPTVAVLHYDLIAERPYARTQEDVQFETWLRRQDQPPDGDLGDVRERFFAAEMACLRASPLGKRYGWGLHYDADGRIALYGVESDEYARLLGGGAGTVLKAMRSRRA